jgi:ribonucleoside-diphosphate reductase alpha chain
VWETKYRFVDSGTREGSIAETWHRVARALAAVEPKNRPAWEERFFSVIEGFKFLPGGRIQAGAGTGRNVTLFNCFVMGTIEDSIPGIFRALQEGAVTMNRGWGMTSRPCGRVVRVQKAPAASRRARSPSCRFGMRCAAPFCPPAPAAAP